MNNVTDAIQNMANNNLLRYMVQKVIFCNNSNCGQVLDYRTAVATEGPGATIVLCPDCWDKMPKKDQQTLENDDRLTIYKYRKP